ncbi:MAG: lipopolysaccharide biosynthesis protein [Candidatus Promineofilum sp.]|nr:lipopolysaccharide biosynthesis protein [Promineifilum sp.]
MSDLKIKTARGSMLMAGITLGMRPVSMVLAIILLRLLHPADFGLIALSMLLMNASNLFTDLGLRPALVQTQHDIRKVAHYAFVLVMLTSIATTIVIVLVAAPIASVLGGGSDLVPILRVMSIIVTIDGLWVVPEALLRRDLKFRQLGVAQVITEISSSLIAIGCALGGLGVWSLAIGNIVAEMLRTLIFWSQSRPWIWLRPQKWDPVIVKSLLRFGAPTMGGGVLRSVQTQLDTWLTSRFFGTTVVGFYDKAYTLTGRLSNMLANTIFGNVLFPSYARIQNEPERLARAYIKSTGMVLLMVMPLSVGLATAAPLLVPVLIGDTWAPMIPLWQIFSVFGLTWAVSANASPLFLALGQPRRNITASLVYIAVLLPTALILLRPFGASGIAVGVSLGYTATMVLNIFQVNQILPGTARKLVVYSLPFFASGTIMGVGILLLRGTIIQTFGGVNSLSLIAVVLWAAFLYIAATILLQRALVTEIYEVLVKALGIDRRWPRLVPHRLRPSK